jgi:hypothetical protein
MNRLESCPLNRVCEKSNERFYKQRTDLKGCKNYFDCQVSSAAVRIPILRHYDSRGGYWQVDTVPTICEWRAYDTRYPSNISSCPIRFFSYSHIEIGYWFDRDLPLPNQYQEFLTLENLVAMEIKQTYYQLGFFDAVPKTPKKSKSSSVENYDWDLRV